MSCLYDNENDFEFKDYDFRRDSDEDTEDASETEAEKKDEEFTGIKDQIYHDQLKQYRRQLQQLKEGSLPLYLKKFKRLEQQFQDRILMNEILSSVQLNLYEQEYIREKELVNKEFEEKKSEMKENLVRELEHKKKTIESERHVMELTGDTTCAKPSVTTRKLRRRPNDPPPAPEKRSKPSPVQLSLNLTEIDTNEDLARLCKLNKTQGLIGGGGGSGGGMGGGFGSPKQSLSSFHPATSSFNSSSFNQSSSFISTHDVFVEEGRLCLDKRWFSKEQSVSVDTKDHCKFNAYISTINPDEIIVKKVSDNTKLKISVSNLQRGFYTLKKRL